MGLLFDLNTKSTVDDKYTKKVQIPQYLPSATKPNIAELYNKSTYARLCYEIDNADISDEDKMFLKLASTRHITFNYSKIADYYAHSDSKVQQLMEKNALVIIDLEDAMANGYVKLHGEIQNLINDSRKQRRGE